MPIIIQLYLLATFGYIILSGSVNRFFSDGLLRWVTGLLLYASIIRVLLGLDLQLPLFFHASVFMAFSLFVPGAYLCLRNSINSRRLDEKDWIHVMPFFVLSFGAFLTAFFGTTIQQEVKQIWSFNPESAFDSKIVMPLFLFVYCLTAFYFYRVLLLFKTKLLKHEGLVPQDNGGKQSLDENSSEKAEQVQFLNISAERMVEIDGIVKEVIGSKKPYLQPRYSLKDLAMDTNVSLHHLSAFINNYWGKNFNDFINEFRVQCCMEKIRNEEYKNKTLEAIAEESGFNNRNTFAIAFKKVTGLKPSEYLRNLKSAANENNKSYEMKTQGYLQSV